MKHLLTIAALYLINSQLCFSQDTIAFTANPVEPTQLKEAISVYNAEVGQPIYFAYSLSANDLREQTSGEIYTVALKFDITGLAILPQAVFPAKKTETDKGIYSLAELKNGRLYGKGVLIPISGKAPEYYDSPYYYNSFSVNNDAYYTLNSFCISEVGDKKRVAEMKLTNVEIDFYNTMSKKATGSPLIHKMEKQTPFIVKLPATSTIDETMKNIDEQRLANYNAIAEKALEKAPAHPDYYMNNYDPAITGVSRKDIETLINNMYQKNDPSFTVIKLSNPSEVSIQKDDYDRVLSKSFQVDYLAKEASGKCAYATIVLEAPFLTNGTFGNYAIDLAGYNRCACNR